MAVPSAITIQPAGAQTVSGNSGAAGVFVGHFIELMVYLIITAVSGTTPSMTVTIQTSPDNGTTWVDGPSFAAQTAAANLALTLGNGMAAGGCGMLVRARWVISGTTPSFTFSILGVGKA